MKHVLARLALGAAAADLALKLLPWGADRVLLPGILGLTHAANSGVAFGLLRQWPGLNLALGFALLLLAALWLLGQRLNRLEALGAGLLLGGALGNLLDRIIHGAVTDYLRFLFMRFPVFNLADACITLGAALTVAGLALGEKEGKHVSAP